MEEHAWHEQVGEMPSQAGGLLGPRVEAASQVVRSGQMTSWQAACRWQSSCTASADASGVAVALVLGSVRFTCERYERYLNGERRVWKDDRAHRAHLLQQCAKANRCAIGQHPW